MEEEPKRKRGAPKGNKNARKHGFYSRLFTEEEHLEWKDASRGQLQPEINLFRVLVARTARRLSSVEAQALSLPESLAMLQAVSMAVARLNSVCRTDERLFAADNKSDIEMWMRSGCTEEEARSGVTGLAGKTRGGQPGNTNALKHGFYASIFNAEEIRKLDKIKNNEVQEEITLLRILIKRTVALLFDQADLGLLDYLRAVRIITYAASCVERLESTQELVSPHPTWWDGFEEALREASKRQGWVA